MSNYNVPEGWKLVPKVAAPAMEQAAEKYWNERRFKALSGDPRSWAGLYAAMLAAAPAAPVARAEPVATVVERKEGSRTWFEGVIHATAIVMEQIKDGDPLYAAPPAHPDAALAGENKRLRKQLLAWANDINWAATHAGCLAKFAAITESMKKEALK